LANIFVPVVVFGAMMRLAETSTLFKNLACPPVFSKSADIRLANTFALAFLPELLVTTILRDTNTCAFLSVVNLMLCAVYNRSVALAKALFSVKNKIVFRVSVARKFLTFTFACFKAPGGSSWAVYRRTLALAVFVMPVEVVRADFWTTYTGALRLVPNLTFIAKNFIADTLALLRIQVLIIIFARKLGCIALTIAI
jgi:hypothetical protein